MPDRQNVLWIMTDQHNFRALGCAPGQTAVDTPNIDHLAEQSVVFDRAYCPSPVCGPSRASMLTGLYPSATGFVGNQHSLPDDVPVLPELLSDAGYHTALAGKLHLRPTAAPHGFDHCRRHDAMYDVYNPEEPWNSEYVRWLAGERFDGDIQAVIDRANEDERAFLERGNLYRFLLGSTWRSAEEHSNTWVADETVEYLCEHREEPFFCLSSFFGPHQPMCAPGEYADMYDPADIELPPEFDIPREGRPGVTAKVDHDDLFSYYESQDWSRAQYREVLAAYYGQVAMIDDCVGRILDALESEGMAEETLVVFTSDHGDHAGQFGWFGKSTMYEGAVRVPLIVRDPGSDAVAGSRSQRNVNLIDLFATILDRCDASGPGRTHSRSLAPLLDEPDSDEWDNATYSELSHSRMLVRDDLKVIRCEDRDGRSGHELIDLTQRPYDGENYWDDPSYQPDQERLVRELLESDRAASSIPRERDVPFS